MYGVKLFYLNWQSSYSHLSDSLFIKIICLFYNIFSVKYQVPGICKGVYLLPLIHLPNPVSMPQAIIVDHLITPITWTKLNNIFFKSF